MALLREGSPGGAEMIRISARRSRQQVTAAIQVNTASLTTLTAGVGSPVKVNVIPSASEATLDCRLLPGVMRPSLFPK